MNKEFVPHDRALKLKALGFDEDCLARYEGKIKHIEKPLVFEFTFANLPGAENKVGYPDYPYKDVEAPTFSQAFRWFREKQAIEGFIHKAIEGTYYFVIKRLGNNESNMYEFITNAPKNVDTFEEAELACLTKLIKIVEND